jgi:hypothetical protein
MAPGALCSTVDIEVDSFDTTLFSFSAHLSFQWGNAGAGLAKHLPYPGEVNSHEQQSKINSGELLWLRSQSHHQHGEWSLILYRDRASVVETADLRSPELSAWDTWGASSQSSSRALARAS